MSSLVFVTGDFSSGSTLLFTLFRKTGSFHCLYEPFHERLLEYLIWPLRAYDRHFHVDDYFTEYRGFRQVPRLFDPVWGLSQLHRDATDRDPQLYRYLSYVIGQSFGRRSRVMLKFNRATFRLGWLKARFPTARIVHVYRDKDDQWNSIVRRSQEFYGREDVGQNRVDFNGFSLQRWCDDLQHTYPELAASACSSGYERFSRLWDLSYREHTRHADVSVALADLTADFRTTGGEIFETVGCPVDLHHLDSFVVRSAAPGAMAPGRLVKAMRSIRRRVDNLGHRYARVRVRLRREWWERRRS